MGGGGAEASFITFQRYSLVLWKSESVPIWNSRVSHADEAMADPRPTARRTSDTKNSRDWRSLARTQSRASRKSRATAEQNHCSAYV